MPDTIESLRDTLAELRAEHEQLRRDYERVSEYREASDRRRAEVEAQLAVAAAPANRILTIISEAEADGTVPDDDHTGEARVLTRIHDALVAAGLLKD